jgi:hypothetical protein
MMMPSSLPNFEIPTGLMGTGLRGLRGFGRGLGAIDLQPLAQACLNGMVGPNSFIEGLTWTPGYASTPQALPGGTYYLNDSTSAAIAAQLGATVVQLPPFDVPAGTNIPLANWIQFPDGTVVLAANIANECNLSPSIPNMTPLCGMQQLLSYAIPDGALDSSCTPNTAAASLVQASAPQNPATLTSGYGLAPLTPYQPQVTTMPAIPTPVLPKTPVSNPVTVANPAGSSVSFTAADSCSTVASKIATLQAAGQSNITIWNQVPDALLTCSAVIALNPTDAMYETGAGASQPGNVSSGGAGSSSTGNNSTAATTTDNTGTYLAIGAAVLIGLWMLSGGNR